jgi:hypothetical protein
MLSELLCIQLSCFVWYLEKEFKNVFAHNLYINDCLEKYVISLCIEMRKTHSKSKLPRFVKTLSFESDEFPSNFENFLLAAPLTLCTLLNYYYNHRLKTRDSIFESCNSRVSKPNSIKSFLLTSITFSEK